MLITNTDPEIKKKTRGIKRNILKMFQIFFSRHIRPILKISWEFIHQFFVMLLIDMTPRALCWDSK